MSAPHEEPDGTKSPPEQEQTEATNDWLKPQPLYFFGGYGPNATERKKFDDRPDGSDQKSLDEWLGIEPQKENPPINTESSPVGEEDLGVHVEIRAPSGAVLVIRIH